MGIPWQEGQVRKGTFITNKPCLAFKDGIEDADDATDFVSVTLDRWGDLLMVKDLEPTESLY